jgi:hypothetical protein
MLFNLLLLVILIKKEITSQFGTAIDIIMGGY